MGPICCPCPLTISAYDPPNHRPDGTPRLIDRSIASGQWLRVGPPTSQAEMGYPVYEGSLEGRDFLNGIEVARRFFAEWGLPFLQERFPELVERTAAGLFRGSQVLGADDALSRDHGWGPMFLLLLTQADYAAQGQAVAQAMIEAAPQEWLGYRYCGGLNPNIEVASGDRYLERWLGFARPPAQWQQWLGGTASGVHEYELYLIRHGHVFSDPLGEFSARRAALAQYPRLARLQRMSNELFNVWHFRQYNFLDRLLVRQDPLAVQMAQGHFIEAALRLCLLLEGDYTPYWKWLAFAFRALPGSMTPYASWDAPLPATLRYGVTGSLILRAQTVAIPTYFRRARLLSGSFASHAAMGRGQYISAVVIDMLGDAAWMELVGYRGGGGARAGIRW